jgi:hypothetical protein
MMIGSPGASVRYEQRSVPVQIAAGALDRLPVIIVGQSVHDERSELTQDIGGNVAGPLRRENTGKAVFAPLFGRAEVDLGT